MSLTGDAGFSREQRADALDHAVRSAGAADTQGLARRGVDFGKNIAAAIAQAARRLLDRPSI